MGIQLRQYAELRGGPFWGQGEAQVETGSPTLPEVDEDLSGWWASLAFDRLDRTVFPRAGFHLAVEGMFASEDLGGDAEFDKVQGIFQGHHSIGDHTLSLGLQGGSGLGSDLPGYAEFTLGGPLGFAGLAEYQFRGSYLAVGSVGYRFRLASLPAQLGRGVFVVTRADAGNVWLDDVDADNLRYGGLIGLGADTVAGPILVAYGRTDEDFDRWYFTVGMAF